MVKVISMTATRHEIMTFSGHVIGTKLTFAVGSGATASIMGWRTANKHGFTITPSKVLIKSQNNCLEKVKGEIKAATVEVDGRDLAIMHTRSPSNQS